jgi:WD40 repeat protein
VQPDDDSWAAVIYASPNGLTQLGTAVVIDGHRLLTCLHVIDGRDRVWIGFPKLLGAVQRGRWAATVSQADHDLDVAILRLDEVAPSGVTAPPVRCPPPHALVDKRWWTFGFESRRGNSSYGTVGASLGDGFVRIDADPGTTYRLRSGFSGAGVWSPDFEAVVGVVVDADKHGNGHAVTLYQIDLCFPEEKISELARWAAPDAGEVALAAWGWTLGHDPENARHWSPRGRGVRVDSEQGYRFRGRKEALSLIVSWLDRKSTDWRTLVITGSPGVGKSAVLGRVVTTADAELRSAVPEDGGVYATLGSVACAVHVKGKTALETAAEIARAASAPLPQTLDDFAIAIKEALTGSRRKRFNIIIDALDEAASAAQARQIITQIILPLLETCSDVGVQIVVGTRRLDDDGSLLEVFRDAAEVINLDDPRFFQEEDLQAYALATLQISSSERTGDPYADEDIARPLAARIAELSGQNFLVAGLTALSHGLHDRTPIDPAHLSITGDVGDALLGYLGQIGPASDIPAVTILTALAFAETPGFPLDLWQKAIHALTGQEITDYSLKDFARSSAANFLVESSGGDSSQVFRLFHQALNEALLYRSQQVDVYTSNKLLTRALIDRGRANSWEDVPAYLLRSLPIHAARAGMIEELLTDDEFLLHADLRRLIPLADDATTPAGEKRARLLWLTPSAISASAAERVAVFSITEALEQLGDSYRSSSRPAPYRARWAATTIRNERGLLESAAAQVLSLTSQGRALLAMAGVADGTVQIWDPYTGEMLRSLSDDGVRVTSLCTITSQGRTLLAAAGRRADALTGDVKRIVQIWDPYTGEMLRSLADGVRVTSLCTITSQGRTFLAMAGVADGTVQIWDPYTGEMLRSLADGVRVTSLCTITSQGRTLLVAAGERTDASTGEVKGIVQIWDPHTGEELHAFASGLYQNSSLCAFSSQGRMLLATTEGYSHTSIWDPYNGEKIRTLGNQFAWPGPMCAFSSRGRMLLAISERYYGISIWDPHTGDKLRTLSMGPDIPSSICAFESRGRTLLASAGHSDRKVRIWDPHADLPTQQHAPTGSVTGLVGFRLQNRTALASVGMDRTVRIWDPDTGELLLALVGHEKQINDICAIASQESIWLVSAGGDRKVLIWDVHAKAQAQSLKGPFFGATAVCAFSSNGRSLLAVAGKMARIRIWDAQTWKIVRALRDFPRSINGLCAFRVKEKVMLASAGADGKVKIWDPELGRLVYALHGHADSVNSVSAFTVDDITLIASAGDDRTIRIWNPETGEAGGILRGHHGPVESVCIFTTENRSLLASAGRDRTVRIWDPGKGEQLGNIPIVHPGSVIHQVDHTLAVGSPAGLIIIEPSLLISSQ